MHVRSLNPLGLALLLASISGCDEVAPINDAAGDAEPKIEKIATTYRAAAVSDLENAPTDELLPGDQVYVAGFEEAGDGGEGSFVWRAEAVEDELLGIEFNGENGSWRRIGYHGKILFPWVGVRATAKPQQFDAGDFAEANAERLNAALAWAGSTSSALVSGDKANFVRAKVMCTAGTFDFAADIVMPDDVSFLGAGENLCQMRANHTSGTFLTVGTSGEFIAEAESGFIRISGLALVHFDGASSRNELNGIGISNATRNVIIERNFIRGFANGLNIDTCFDITVENNTIVDNHEHAIEGSGAINSMRIVDNRLEASQTEAIMKLAGTGARNIVVHRNEIQRGERIGILLSGVAQAEISANQFEGNNRTDGSHPDLWIEGSGVRIMHVRNNYFTGLSRRDSTTSRAINIRNDVTGTATFFIQGNEQKDSGQGSFTQFIDIDANVPMTVYENGNLYTATNSIPGNVVLNP